jgi:hypothetical protein
MSPVDVPTGLLTRNNFRLSRGPGTTQDVPLIGSEGGHFHVHPSQSRVRQIAIARLFFPVTQGGTSNSSLARIAAPAHSY